MAVGTFEREILITVTRRRVLLRNLAVATVADSVAVVMFALNEFEKKAWQYHFRNQKECC
jgi:hypothetical protein